MESPGEAELLSGIRVNVRVTMHDNEDPLFLGGQDLWEENSGLGYDWGFLDVVYGYDSSGAGNSEISGRLGTGGYMSFVVGLGQRQCLFGGAPNPNYALPGSDNSQDPDGYITTRVEVEIEIPSMPDGSTLTHKVHVVFRRFPEQDFFFPIELFGQMYPSVYNWCYTGLNEAPDYDMMMSMGSATEPSLERIAALVSSIEHAELEPVNSFAERPEDPEPKDQKKKYKFKKPKKNMVNESFGMDGPVGFGVTDRVLYRLEWDQPDPNDPGTADYYFYPAAGPMYGIFAPDPNELIKILNYSMPYSWSITAVSPVVIPDGVHVTMELQALTDPNDYTAIANKMPIDVDFLEKSPDGLTVTGVTGWFMMTADEGLEGTYTDDFANEWIVFYMPPESRLRISWQNPYGDFNHDGIVDVLDLINLSRSWLLGPPSAGLEYLNFEGSSPDIVNLDEFGGFYLDWMYGLVLSSESGVTSIPVAMDGGMEMETIEMEVSRPVLTVEEQIAQAEESLVFLNNIKEVLGEDDHEGMTESIEELVEGLEDDL